MAGPYGTQPVDFSPHPIREPKPDFLAGAPTQVALNKPDVATLYCAKFFYVVIQPNKAKAMTAASKLKDIADNTHNSGFIDFATGELAELSQIPDDKFESPRPELLNALHSKFPNEFPNIKMGLKLRAYLNP